MTDLTTAADVFDALGGIDAVAELTGAKYTAAQNWKAFNAFPPRTYLVMTERLQQAGFKAPPSLWRMVGAD